jgi:acetylglutamate kinase
MTSNAGAALNVNGDDAAAAIAAALGAELWLVADVEGVLADDGSVLPELDQHLMSSLVAGGTVNRGMHAKLEAGFAALSGGCPAVRVCSLDAFTDPEAGTFLTPTPSLT